MSLAIVVKSPSGIVLAADSRVTLGVKNQQTNETFSVHYDNATKLLRFNPPHNFVGAVTFGQAVVPPTMRTAESFLPEFESGLPRERLSVQDFSVELANFYADQFKMAMPYTGPGMIFYVAGYDASEPYGKVFKLTVPNELTPEEQTPNSFGAAWGGQMEIVDRIYKGIQFGLPDKIATDLALTPDQTQKLQALLAQQQLQIPIDAMALQDCVDLAVTLIRTTISIQGLQVTLRGVGGPVDVVTITRTDGLRVLKVKETTVNA